MRGGGWGRRGAALLALSMAVWPVAGSAQEVGEGARTVTVTPNTDLVDGQTVSIHGEGWGPREVVFAVQCATDVPLVDGCEFLDEGRAGPQGRFTFPVEVAVVLETDAGSFDCRVDPCRIGVAGESGGAIRFVDLGFDPLGPDPQRPTASVDPDTGLVDGQEVAVTGEGFPLFDPDFGGFASVQMCREPVVSTAADCDEGTRSFAFVERNGHLEARYHVFALLELAGGPYDCRTSACSVLVAPDLDFGPPPLSRSAIVPVAFDPAGPLLPPPTLTVDPATGLEDGDVVHVHAAGLLPNSAFTIEQCVAGATSELQCEADLISFGFTDDTGEIDGFMSLRARFPNFYGAVDCRTRDCAVVVANPTFHRRAEAITAFDPDSDLLHPTIEVTPTTGLHDGDEVTIRGTGWRPSVFGIVAAQCPAGAFDEFDCDPDTLLVVEERQELPESLRDRERVPLAPTREAAQAELGIDFEVSFTVRAQLRPEFGPPVDCRVDACEILVTDVFDAPARARLSFAADDGPITATPPFTG